MIFRISTYSRLVKSIAIIMLVAGLTAAQALAPAGPNRPATVPADYVITPFGYFHPSCVMHVSSNTDVVRQDLNIVQHADGSSEKIPRCAYPHYKPNGEEVIGDEQGSTQPGQPPLINGWVEYASVRTDTSYAYLSAYWSVPPTPSTNHGQTVYMFPGMEDYKGVVTIIQPVLGWNSDYNSAWGIASWNCCKNGTTFEGPPTKTNSGDTIFGYMFETCPFPSKSCPTWTVVTYDLTLGTYSQLNTGSWGQTFDWAFAGALEVYSVVQCTDYPPNGAVGFYNLQLYDYTWKPIANPAWTITNLGPGKDPQCGYGGSLPQQLTLTY